MSGDVGLSVVSDVVNLSVGTEKTDVQVVNDVVSVKTGCWSRRGPAGVPGVATWDSGVTYSIGDVVYFDGRFWDAVEASIGAQPVNGVSAWKEIKPSIPSVRIATFENILGLYPYVYDNGVDGVGATISMVNPGVLVMETIPVSLGDRVLFGKENNPIYNGVYECTVEGTASVSAVFTRTKDMDDGRNFPGAVFYVEAGFTGGNTQRIVAYRGSMPFTIGSTPILFRRVDEIIPGPGIKYDANTVSADIGYVDRALTTTGFSYAYNPTGVPYSIMPMDASTVDRIVTLPLVSSVTSNKVRIGVSVFAIGAGKTVKVQTSPGDTFFRSGGPTSLTMTTLNQMILFQVGGANTSSKFWTVVGSYLSSPDDIPNGLPSGGTTDQILSKVNNNDFEAHWVDPIGVADTPDIDLTKTGQIISASLKPTGVTDGSYTNASVTVDEDGRITSIADGLPSASLIVDTKQELLGQTPPLPTVGFASDSREYFVFDGTSWNVASLRLSEELETPDMGYAEDSDKLGYTGTTLTDKTLYNITLKGNSRPENGAIRVDVTQTPNRFQVFLRGKWNTLYDDITTEYGDFRHTPLTKQIYIWRGDSVEVGLNGRPVVQEYSVSMGAFPPPKIISGGEFL